MLSTDPTSPVPVQGLCAGVCACAGGGSITCLSSLCVDVSEGSVRQHVYGVDISLVMGVGVHVEGFCVGRRNSRAEGGR